MFLWVLQDSTTVWWVYPTTHPMFSISPNLCVQWDKNIAIIKCSPFHYFCFTKTNIIIICRDLNCCSTWCVANVMIIIIIIIMNLGYSIVIKHECTACQYFIQQIFWHSCYISPQLYWIYAIGYIHWSIGVLYIAQSAMVMANLPTPYWGCPRSQLKAGQWFSWKVTY